MVEDIFKFTISFVIFVALFVSGVNGFIYLSESGSLRKELTDDRLISYVTIKKEIIEDLTSVDKEVTSSSREGNSVLGKFFLSDEESLKEEKYSVNEIYYFTKTEFGYEKHQLSDTIHVDEEKNNVFYQTVEDGKNPFIEVKEAQFKDKAKEEKRIKNEVSREIYIIHAPTDVLNVLKKVDFE
ncbi:hypothetical protein ACIQTG_001542 [Enterococcus faecalis]|uniref:hypothetical protein n=1 Tax=Enterococcus faecalis TaxID=1351 RepID=UPI000F811AB5|nr:hypothetical protein [Enterococcus faecalis]EGO7892788.1 hypothetical protein [Enterococcus faecalis]EGO9245662.1 hypothetical protein [Enterococcus faecalis]EIB3116130.1 hypothetical protein [Enterococcus faecalis]EIP8133091.1 hypothetical protein [Enterococcus faecalis]EJB2789459.1 hypothetical protein [Enterococcus faecalis]